MQRLKRWNIAPDHPSAQDLAARLKTSPLIAQMLLNRGLSEPADCQSFLTPKLTLMHEPASLPGLPAAAERLVRALRDRQKIFIYGDYDVDGITACSILWHAIRLLGGDAGVYIPHRIDEGYGLNSEAITQLCDQGAQLIITVDCGITALDQARLARERGVDLIITDHHLWKENNNAPEGAREALGAEAAEAGDAADPALSPRVPLLPDCHAIVHPRLPRDGPAYGNPHLCGAGVAYKLAWGAGLLMTTGSLSPGGRVDPPFKQFLLEATALAALGTIADVVPLVGENRALAHFGLKGLEKTQLLGLRALIDSAKLGGTKLDSYHVGFLLGPRLNACGRMGHAMKAVQMLTRANELEAHAIATELEEANRLRQAMEKRITAAALAQVKENGLDADDCRAVVLGAADWHPGVIGIVAGRMVDKLHRPAILVALTKSGAAAAPTGGGKGNATANPDPVAYSQGSGRSIPGFHLTRALAACQEHLHSFGGHEMAAGLKIEAKHFRDFRDAFCQHARQHLSDAMCVAELNLEGLAELRQVTHALVDHLQLLGPFGHANRKPLLALRGLEVLNPRRMGKGQEHLQLTVRQNGAGAMRCVGWGMGEWAELLRPGAKVDLAVEPKLNEWNGRVSVELEVKDLRFGEE